MSAFLALPTNPVDTLSYTAHELYIIFYHPGRHDLDEVEYLVGDSLTTLGLFTPRSPPRPPHLSPLRSLHPLPYKYIAHEPHIYILRIRSTIAQLHTWEPDVQVVRYTWMSPSQPTFPPLPLTSIGAHKSASHVSASILPFNSSTDFATHIHPKSIVV